MAKYSIYFGEDMRYLVLFEDFKTSKKKFLDQGIKENEIDEVFKDFRDLSSKNQIKGVDKNIDTWSNKPFSELKKFVDDLKSKPTATQIKRKQTPGKSITLMENPNWLVVIPLDKEASCFHGRGSSWCTTMVHQNYFEQYFYDKEVILVYCLNKQSGSKWAIAIHKDLDQAEFFDQADTSISESNFEQQTGLDYHEIRNLALKDNDQVKSSRQVYTDNILKIESYMDRNEINSRNIELEKLLSYAKPTNYCKKYILDLISHEQDINEIDDSIINSCLLVSTVDESSRIINNLRNIKNSYADIILNRHPNDKLINEMLDKGWVFTNRAWLILLKSEKNGSVSIYI